MSIRDARTDAVGPVLEAPICIIGAGAAGITLARALSAKGAEVLVIESGGLDYDDETQALYRGPNVGLPYHELDACRLRYFGGTTNHWGGYCRSNDPINYAARPDLGIDGWPVTFDELEPYVAAAATMLGISPEFFDPGALLAVLGEDPAIQAINAEPDFFLAVNQIAEDIRFAERFGDEFETASRLHLVTHLNATDIAVSEEGATVTSVECATLTGKAVTVRARHFVLACHSIENARLLLASTDLGEHGVGNAHDQVGRHFMEHLMSTRPC